MSIAEYIVRAACEAARQNRLVKITRITLEIGRFSGVEPGALELAFGFVKKDTLAEQAQLEILSPPLLLFCKRCEMEYAGTPQDLRCPTCLGEELDILAGREMLVKSIAGV
jgi:hydrogenase nickel incorporation protein HypA/HybF